MKSKTEEEEDLKIIIIKGQIKFFCIETIFLLTVNYLIYF